MCRNEAYSCIVRFRDSGGWTPVSGSWCRAWVSCQNKVANGKYAVTGSILLLLSGTNFWIGTVSGGVSGYSDLTVSWNKYYTENDIMKNAGTLFGRYGTMIVSSQSNSTSSIEGSQINFYGMGGNTGETISLDGYNNHFRIISKFNGTSIVVYEFTKDGIFKNGVKICG